MSEMAPEPISVEAEGIFNPETGLYTARWGIPGGAVLEAMYRPDQVDLVHLLLGTAVESLGQIHQMIEEAPVPDEVQEAPHD